ncbi:MAG: RNA 3'-terminal phosphate cyclase [Candidatus Aenigmatarchaeota archaeon]
MILIDGSIGEAGGQILRTSIALSSLLLKPIKVFNIRKGRAKPGLMAQHLAGVKFAGEFCNAEIKGLKIGSTELEFIPKSFNIEDKRIEIGTAGQISLILQTLTPLLIFGGRKVKLEIVGGTAGLGAPTIHYVKNVLFPLISRQGIKAPEIEVLKEGFYPKGGGIVKVGFCPAKKLNSIRLLERGKVRRIKGISIAGSLSQDVAERQANSAAKLLKEYGFETEIIAKSVETFSPGTSITLWAECENSVIGADNIGKKGVKAETIGEECAKELINSIESKAALDKYMADQILIFLALAESESSVTVEKITQHCLTNIKIIEQMLSVKFKIEENFPARISVKGIGFEARE